MLGKILKGYCMLKRLFLHLQLWHFSLSHRLRRGGNMIERPMTFVDRAMEETGKTVGWATEIVSILASEVYPKGTVEVYRARFIAKALGSRRYF